MKICQQSLLTISQSKLVYSLKIGGTVMLLIETRKKNGYSVSSIGECKVPYPQGYQYSMLQTCAFLPSMKLSQLSACKHIIARMYKLSAGIKLNPNIIKK